MAPRKRTPVDVLVTGLDRAAKILLDGAFPVTTKLTEPPENGAEGDPKPVLADQIKAFMAVSKWATERSDLVTPAEKVRGKGEQLRDDFQRATGIRGNGSATTEDPTGTD